MKSWDCWNSRTFSAARMSSQEGPVFAGPRRAPPSPSRNSCSTPPARDESASWTPYLLLSGSGRDGPAAPAPSRSSTSPPPSSPGSGMKRSLRWRPERNATFRPATVVTPKWPRKCRFSLTSSPCGEASIRSSAAGPESMKCTGMGGTCSRSMSSDVNSPTQKTALKCCEGSIFAWNFWIASQSSFRRPLTSPQSRTRTIAPAKGPGASQPDPPTPGFPPLPPS
mmetsp:Transcript_26783/g.58871  ORF Transcript_26783/g.58871 Transcript_26783/m.58871 type:complete len:224 (-) Transcript_26783:8-679(-)